MQRPFRLAITTGDTDGIGLEVACKALNKIGPKKDFQFILWRSPKASRRDLTRIDSSFKRIIVSSWHEALIRAPRSYKEIIDVNSTLSPARWVEEAAQASYLGHIDGMATAPISKTSIHEAGMRDIGHTEILKRVCAAPHVFMGFLGPKINVVLATGHIPVEKVTASLSQDVLENAILAAARLRTLLPRKIQTRPIAVLGLNPHAGEESLIGEQESTIHTPVISKLQKKKLAVEGPFPADSLFFSNRLEKFSVFVANYHDQGLIPFKALQNETANAHVTLGLPFVRTSVDHGTAKDIFGKNRADVSSMIRAIELALQLCRDKTLLVLDP